MNVSTSTRAVLAHAAEVVAAEVDEHHVLGALLLVGEQLLGDRARPRRRRRRAGACRRSGASRRARPETVSSGSGEAPTIWKSSKSRKYMYGRRVDRAQPAVDRERLDRRLGAVQRWRRDDLEGVAGVDVLDDPGDHRLELLARHVRLELGAGAVSSGRARAGARRPGAAPAAGVRARAQLRAARARGGPRAAADAADVHEVPVVHRRARTRPSRVATDRGRLGGRAGRGDRPPRHGARPTAGSTSPA